MDKDSGYTGLYFDSPELLAIFTCWIKTSILKEELLYKKDDDLYLVEFKGKGNKTYKTYNVYSEYPERFNETADRVWAVTWHGNVIVDNIK